VSRRALRLAPWATLAPALLTLAVLFGAALVGAIRQSLEPPLGGDPSTWSLDAWRALLGDPVFGNAVLFSLRITVVATTASALLALAVVGAVRRSTTALRVVFSLPIPVPHLLVATTGVLWLGPGGLADRALGSLPINLVRDRLGLGIIVVYVYKETPFLVLLLLTAMGSALAEREEAAAVLGAGPGQRLRWVVWPSVRRPLCVGSLIVAAFVLGAFEVPLVIGPNASPTIATYAEQATQNDAITGRGLAAAALLVAAAASVLLAFGVARLGRGRSLP